MHLIILFLSMLALAFATPLPVPDSPDEPDMSGNKLITNLFTLPQQGGDNWAVDVDGKCHNLQSPVAGTVHSIAIPQSSECSLYKTKDCKFGEDDPVPLVAAPGASQLSFTKVFSLKCIVVPPVKDEGDKGDEKDD